MIPPGWSHKVYTINSYRIKVQTPWHSNPLGLHHPFQMLLISHQSCLWSRTRKGLHQCLNISCTFTFPKYCLGCPLTSTSWSNISSKFSLHGIFPADLSHAILMTPFYEVPENSVSTSKKYIKLFIGFSHIYCLIRLQLLWVKVRFSFFSYNSLVILLK